LEPDGDLVPEDDEFAEEAYRLWKLKQEQKR